MSLDPPVRTERICVNCGKRNDAHQPAPGQHMTAIAAGAVLVCAYCGKISIATETGTRIPTDVELATMMADPTVASIFRFVNEQLAPKLARRGN